MNNPALLYLSEWDEASIQQQLKGWKSEHPNCGVLAMVAEQSKADIPRLQKITHTSNVPLIGAMFPELIFEGTFKRTGLTLILFKEMPPYLLVENLSQFKANLDDVAKQFTSKFNLQNGGEHSLFLLFDAMVPNISTILDALFRQLADEYHFAGVNAGSETFQPMPCLFDNEHFTDDAVLAFFMPNHPGAILAHNYTEPNETIIATSTEGNRIASINWRPAFEVYAELIEKHYNTKITKENFYEYGVHFPFGIMRVDEQALVRIPVALEDDGSLFCVGEIPENTLLTLLQAVEPGNNLSIDTVIKSRSKTPNSNIALGFYCAGRRMHLGEAASQELYRWYEAIQPSQLVGALSLGEIGDSQSGGYPLFHNATLVYAPWTD